jgi:FKBP-type peptidyl-prolyl cis-trans isomerase 2
MGKTIITFGEVIDLNHMLEEKKLYFKVHLHDACGSQSFTIEPLGNCACENHYDTMREEIEKYFEEKRISVKFSTDNLSFTVI